jgi:choline dehydrogenase-like flavoprotein
VIVAPEDRPGDLDEHAEVAVVGTGAGGAVVAAELAEAGLDVALLEEGDAHPPREHTGRPFERAQRLYRDLGLTGTIGNTFIPVPLGRAVGGTTVINSGTCWRAPEEVLERWERERGIQGVARGGLTPEYERVEQAIGVTPVPEALLGPGATLFRRGAEALGLRGAVIPRNARGCRGTGVCVFGCPRGAKQSTDVAYVPRALAAGARLHVRARVERVVLENGRARGVIATRLGGDGRPAGTLRVAARRVVVAAGALLTPLLLARSALAPRGSQVGRHLRIHPAVRVLAVFDHPVRAWEGVPQSYHLHELEPEGIVVQGMFVPPDVQAAAVPGAGPAHKERMAAYERMASFGALISERSSGRVLALGRRSLAWYWLGRDDVRRLLRGVALVARVFFAAGAREVFPGVRQRPVVRAAAEAGALERLPARARDLDLMAFHPMGTARLGADPAASATDPSGRLRGVDGVYVADASLLPTSTRVNPQLTIMALATRVAAGIAAETARRLPAFPAAGTGRRTSGVATGRGRP